MSEKLRFLQLVGLPASGKSTVAMELMEDRDDIAYLSSDLIRLELFGSEEIQIEHSRVFELMRVRTLQALKSGRHVIYDATNISRKRRKGLLQQIPNDVEKVACYVSTNYKDIIEQNENRERKVPVEAINKMYKQLHIPIYSEGWDKIIFFHHDSTMNGQHLEQFSEAVRAGVLLGREGYELMHFLSTYFEEFSGVYELAQDSKYHSFSVSRHIYHVYKYILENYQTDDEEDKEVMLWTALLHDVGKHFCKSFLSFKGEETKYANFIGHENVSAQMAVHLLKKLNYSDEFIHRVTTLIQFHMYLLNKDANKDKLKSYVGEDNFKKLEILRTADTLAH